MPELNRIFNSDESLVRCCLAGDRDAFALIVGKYQSLVCAVAYSATGNFASSEELAQDAFLVAWRSMNQLRNAAGLKSWLCGIVRNLAHQSIRKRQNCVLDQTEVVDELQLVDRKSADPAETVATREEIEIVDQALARLPELYREPMVLYYREAESVSRVAELLELSTDAVKQRLARGRHMLQRSVASIVESGLRQTAPTRAFTIAVIAALPILSATANAATITVTSATLSSATATSAKGVGAMNAASWLGILGAIVGPIVGLAGAWFGYWVSLKSARSQRERQYIRSMAAKMIVLIILFIAALSIALAQGRNFVANHPRVFALSIIGLVVGYSISLVWMIVTSNRSLARIRREDEANGSSRVQDIEQMPTAVRQFQYARIYESKAKLFGIPLISIRFNGAVSAPLQRKPAVGWIAIGDFAIGIVFAAGSFAVGTVSTGAIGIGLVSFGGMAIGAAVFGGMGLGILVYGGMALGWMASGGIAIAWRASMGGISVARDFALGGLAISAHANDVAAQTFVEQHPFFQIGAIATSPWASLLLVALTLTIVFGTVRLVRPSST